MTPGLAASSLRRWLRESGAPEPSATTGPLASDEVLDDSTSNPVRLLAKGEVTRAAFLRDVGRPPGNAATQVTKAPKKRPQRPALRHADIARHPKAHSQHPHLHCPSAHKWGDERTIRTGSGMAARECGQRAPCRLAPHE